MPHSLISPLTSVQSTSSPQFKFGPGYTNNPLSCRLLESFVRGVVERTLDQTVGEASGCQTKEIDISSLSASHPDISFARLSPASNRLDSVAHARDSATISKVANSYTGSGKKDSSGDPYLEVRENRKDRSGGGGGSGRSREHNRECLLSVWFDHITMY